VKCAHILLAMRVAWIVLVAAITAAQVAAQAPAVWMMQESGTTAGLRGIDSVDGTVAWASGTGGTVLRTIDAGVHWTKCAVPDAEKDGGTLDFRGVQAWDEKTAIVMASGPGEKSRLYKTVDGCGTWRLVFRNPDNGGFWDAVSIWDAEFVYPAKPRQLSGWILGDPVHGRIRFFNLYDGYSVSGLRPEPWYNPSLTEDETKSLRANSRRTTLFAASNSAFAFVPLVPLDGKDLRNGAIWPFTFAFVTGGTSGARLYTPIPQEGDVILSTKWIQTSIPVGDGTKTAGAFSVALASDHRGGVIVGGNFLKPDGRFRTAAYFDSPTGRWLISSILPHGYRSTVQWSESLKAWISAGTNGSDISRDDGKTWKPLDNGNWNALSLPFIVGPNGRIARLNAGALPKP
jgi:hypothetical protein